MTDFGAESANLSYSDPGAPRYYVPAIWNPDAERTVAANLAQSPPDSGRPSHAKRSRDSRHSPPDSASASLVGSAERDVPPDAATSLVGLYDADRTPLPTQFVVDHLDLLCRPRGDDFLKASGCSVARALHFAQELCAALPGRPHVTYASAEMLMRVFGARGLPKALSLIGEVCSLPFFHGFMTTAEADPVVTGEADGFHGSPVGRFLLRLSAKQKTLVVSAFLPDKEKPSHTAIEATTDGWRIRSNVATHEVVGDLRQGLVDYLRGLRLVHPVQPKEKADQFDNSYVAEPGQPPAFVSGPADGRSRPKIDLIFADDLPFPDRLVHLDSLADPAEPPSGVYSLVVYLKTFGLLEHVGPASSENGRLLFPLRFLHGFGDSLALGVVLYAQPDDLVAMTPIGEPVVRHLVNVSTVQLSLAVRRAGTFTPRLDVFEGYPRSVQHVRLEPVTFTSDPIVQGMEGLKLEILSAMNPTYLPSSNVAAPEEH